jgi:hypothetical protein
VPIVGLNDRKRDSGQDQSAIERKTILNVIAKHSLERRLSGSDLKLLEEVWNHRNAFHLAKRFWRNSGFAPESALARVLQVDVEKRAHEHYNVVRGSFFARATVRSLPAETLKALESVL